LGLLMVGIGFTLFFAKCINDIPTRDLGVTVQPGYWVASIIVMILLLVGSVITCGLKYVVPQEKYIINSNSTSTS